MSKTLAGHITRPQTVNERINYGLWRHCSGASSSPISSSHIHKLTMEKQKPVPEIYTTQELEQVPSVMSVLRVSRPSLSLTRASSTPNPSTRKKLPPSPTSSPAPTEKQPTRKPLVDREEIVQRPVGVPRKLLPGSGKTLWQKFRDSGVSVIAHSSNCDSE